MKFFIVFHPALAFAVWTSVFSAQQIRSSTAVWKSLVKKSQIAVGVGRIKTWEPMSLHLIYYFPHGSMSFLYKLFYINYIKYSILQLALSRMVFCIYLFIYLFFFQEKPPSPTISRTICETFKILLFVQKQSLFQDFLIGLVWENERERFTHIP